MVLKRNNPIRVSVCMPTYNASRYVEEAIESVLAQNHRQFELLIADDGSQDNTLKVISQYRHHPKVRIFSNEKNLGPGTTRNKLVCLSKGEYITPCDDDDLMLQNNLKKLSHYLDIHPMIGMVYGDLLVLDVGKDGALLSKPCISGKDPDQTWDLLENAIGHPGCMIRKSLILKVGGYDETVYSVDDWSLWLKLSEITKFKYLEGKIYYVWRKNPQSITRNDPKANSDLQRLIREAVQRRYGIKNYI